MISKDKLYENIKKMPVIDGHCHPFNPDSEGSYDFRLDFNLYHGGADEDMVKDVLSVNAMVEGIGELLGFPDNASIEDIIRERNSLYKKDPAAYIFKLFNNVNFEKLLLDTGYPHPEFGVDSVRIENFKGFIPCSANEIFRIEPLIYNFFQDASLDFFDALKIFNDSIDDAVLKRKVIGLKSIIAYETGLNIKIYNEDEAGQAYKRYLSGKSKEDEKIIRDFFVVYSLKKCRDFNIPMQLHTGMGSVPILKLQKANPIIMMDFLNNKEIYDTKIVLTHAGHPYEQETGMLVGSFKNLYCDVSAISSYFGSCALKTALLRLFELAPINKIIFGTDGGIIPETYWMGGAYGKKDLANALNEVIKSGWLNPVKAEKYAFMILNENARDLYKI
jgi:uncharacterized protein